VMALAVYPRIDEKGIVVPVSLGMYAIGAAYFALRGRGRPTHRLEPRPHLAHCPAPRPGAPRWLHLAAVLALVVALGVLGAITLAAFGGPDPFGSPGDGPVLVVLGVLAAALAAVAGVELWQTRRRSE
jgi:hypothetical protein